MSRKLFALVLLLLVAVLLSSSLVAAQSTRSWLVIGKNGRIAANLEARIIANGGVITARIPEIGVLAVSAPSADFANGVGGIRSIVPNRIYQFNKPTVVESAPELDYANPPFSGDDDTRFNLQWGHTAVKAVDAWNNGVFGAGARVAVLDGGFDLDHPDLAPNIDFAASKNFVDGETLSYAFADPFSHGTHVAGTIAAADNGFGIIGVAPQAQLVLVKVLGDEGSGSFEDVIEGIVWAANQNVDIINMSLGADIPQNGFCDEFGCTSASEVAELKVAIQRAVNYATQQGALVIVSAGNDGRNLDADKAMLVLPAGVSNAVAISATAPIGWAIDPLNANLDFLASYSNYGQSEIDIAAPGGDSAYPGNELCTIGGLTRPCWVFDLVFSAGSNLNPGVASFYWSAGTSMAAPHAAGVAALIVSQKGSMHPAQLLAELRAQAADLGKPGHDAAYGAGRAQWSGSALSLPPAP